MSDRQRAIEQRRQVVDRRDCDRQQAGAQHAEMKRRASAVPPGCCRKAAGSRRRARASLMAVAATPDHRRLGPRIATHVRSVYGRRRRKWAGRGGESMTLRRRTALKTAAGAMVMAPAIVRAAGGDEAAAGDGMAGRQLPRGQLPALRRRGEEGDGWRDRDRRQVRRPARLQGTRMPARGARRAGADRRLPRHPADRRRALHGHRRHSVPRRLARGTADPAQAHPSRVREDRGHGTIRRSSTSCRGPTSTSISR